MEFRYPEQIRPSAVGSVRVPGARRRRPPRRRRQARPPGSAGCRSPATATTGSTWQWSTRRGMPRTPASPD